MLLPWPRWRPLNTGVLNLIAIYPQNGAEPEELLGRMKPKHHAVQACLGGRARPVSKLLQRGSRRGGRRAGTLKIELSGSALTST